MRMGMNERQEAGAGLSTSASPQAAAPTDEAKNPLLVALGERVRKLRAQRGLARKAVALAGGGGARTDEAKSPLLVARGERVRKLRAQRGLTRKAVALAAGISERHLANLEYGTGNASILVLQQVAGALHCAL